MADTKISALTADTVVTGAVEFPINDAGTSKKATLTAVRNAVQIGNASVAQQAFTTTDAYITGSSILIPDGSLVAKTSYRLRFEITKTSTTSSVSAPILQIRFGTAGTTADTSRCSLTFPAQTAVADTGFMDVYATFRTVGSGTSTVLTTVGVLFHTAATTGLSVSNAPRVLTTSAGFDSTPSGSIIGASINFGTSWAGSLNLVQSELVNLA